VRRFMITLAAWLICLSPISYAQTNDEMTAAFADIAEYSAKLKPVIDQMYGMVTPIDEASLVIDGFTEGAISSVEAKEQLEVIRQRKAELSDLVRQNYDAIGAQPDVSRLGPKMSKARIGLSPEDFDDMFEALNAFTDEFLDLSDKIISGDSEAAASLALKTTERAELLISLGNAQIEADIASIPSEKHPQKQVLRSAINSNNASLDMFLAYQDIEVDRDAFSARINNLKEIVVEHKSILAEGIASQKSVQGQIKTAIRASRPSERSMMRRVQSMMNAYDDAWDVERAFIASVERFISEIEQADLGVEDTMQLLDGLGESIMTHEEDRTRLIFERIALLQ